MLSSLSKGRCDYGKEKQKSGSTRDGKVEAGRDQARDSHQESAEGMHSLEYFALNPLRFLSGF